MALRPIFYDTETTGVKPERDRIIELAAYDPLNDKTFEMLINPGCPIPAEATSVHHITDEMVAKAPTFVDVAHQFLDFCCGDVMLIAHNNDAFDFHFLKHEYNRVSVALPPWKYFDTLKWARRYRRDLPKHPLQYLREVYGVKQNNAHRALDDVLVLYQVYEKMIDDLTADQVWELMNKPRPLQHMPFGKHQGMPLKKVPASYYSWLKGSGALEKDENRELKQSLQALSLI